MKYSNILKRSLQFLTIVVVTVLSSSFSYSQCLQKDEASFELIQDELKIDLSNYSGDLASYKLRLYNYETTTDFISVDLVDRNQTNVEFIKDEKRVLIKNVPDGEYLIIFENTACNNVYLGEGFSGFPYSGIRIE